MAQTTVEPINLQGLVAKSEQEIVAMSFEELAELIEDLRHVGQVQKNLPGVKLCDRVTRSRMTHRDLVEMVLDVRSIAKTRAN